jgi:hypothetical protein
VAEWYMGSAASIKIRFDHRILKRQRAKVKILKEG